MPLLTAMTNLQRADTFWPHVEGEPSRLMVSAVHTETLWLPAGTSPRGQRDHTLRGGNNLVSVLLQYNSPIQTNTHREAITSLTIIPALPDHTISSYRNPS